MESKKSKKLKSLPKKSSESIADQTERMEKLESQVESLIGQVYSLNLQDKKTYDWELMRKIDSLISLSSLVQKEALKIKSGINALGEQLNSLQSEEEEPEEESEEEPEEEEDDDSDDEEDDEEDEDDEE